MKQTWGLAVAMAGMLLMPAAEGALIPFDFNPLADGASNHNVELYMNNVLSLFRPGSSVDVTGAKGEKNYNGDGHVVGPVTGSIFTNNKTVVSETLGTSDGSVHHGGPFDAFLVNNTNTDRIRMDFSFPIYSAAFDYEIFPDGTCTDVNGGCNPSTGNYPDFKFAADGTTLFVTQGGDPANGGTPFPHSPNSKWFGTEQAPQFLGTSALWNFPNGVTRLEFIDWPRQIGIDNLQINDTRPPPPVPEPSSLFLMGSGLIGLAGVSFRKRQ